MRRERGTYTTVDNVVAAYLKRHRDASASVLMALAERHNYSKLPPLTVPALMIECGLKERAVEKALVKLLGLGLAHRGANGWVYGETNADANGNAYGKAYERTPAEGVFSVPDEEKISLKELEGKKNISSLAGRDLIGVPASLPASPSGEGQSATRAAALPGTDEAHETAIPVIPPSSENPSRPAGEATDQLPVTAGQAHKEVREKSHEPTPPDARMFFGLLCGGYFVSRQRLNVERWFAQYTPEFLQLAWQLAPTVEGGKAQYVFVDWLDRSPSRIWPPALVAQHARDVAIVPAPAQRPNEGETWTCRAGTGPVVEVNPRAQVATIQWGPEPGDVIELPWAAMQPARSA